VRSPGCQPHGRRGHHLLLPLLRDVLLLLLRLRLPVERLLPLAVDRLLRPLEAVPRLLLLLVRAMDGLPSHAARSRRA